VEDVAGPVPSAETFFSEAQAVSDANDNVTAKNVAVALRKLEFMITLSFAGDKTLPVSSLLQTVRSSLFWCTRHRTESRYHVG
jgi:hypothetical protein